MTKKAVLVTGGAGFIGGHLSRALLSEGHCVRVLDSLDAQVHPDGVHHLPDEVSLVRGDIRDPGVVRRALEGVEVVFHDAAAVGVGQSMFQIRKYVEVNSLGTANLLDILANEEHDVRRLVVASSNTVYGEGRYSCPRCGPVSPGMRPLEQLRAGSWEMRCPLCGGEADPVPTDEDKPLQPTTVYAITKRDQEEMCLEVGRAYGLGVVALRYFNVLGPGQSLRNPYTGVCAIFSTRIRGGSPPVVYEDGLQTRDIVSVHDVVQANLLALREGSMNLQRFNVGTGVPTKIVDIARNLLELHGTDLEPSLPGRFRAGDVRHCYADISRIRKHGYEPTRTFSQAIGEFHRWTLTEAWSDRFDEAENEMNRRGLLG